DDLKPEDVEEFKNNLDETAFPFEEKAINVHEKNIELLHAGVLNTWTEKSLSKLTELMPGRYAKHEVSSGFLAEIEVLDAATVLVMEQVRPDYEAAVRMLEEAQYEPGIALLLKVSEEAPGLPPPPIDPGMPYASPGNLERSEASLNKALELNPHPAAYNELGIVHRRN